MSTSSIIEQSSASIRKKSLSGHVRFFPLSLALVVLLNDKDELRKSFEKVNKTIKGKISCNDFKTFHNLSHLLVMIFSENAGALN